MNVISISTNKCETDKWTNQLGKYPVSHLKTTDLVVDSRFKNMDKKVLEL